ncbi:MAG: PIG-L deacetylase family protein [Syntrophobacteraceae bacterium]
MIKFNFQIPVDGNLNILCLGAHSDDIEIGCGGTVLRLLEEYPDVSVHWVVFGAEGARAAEAQESAGSFLEKAKHKAVVIRNFRDGFFPYIGAEIKEYFEELKNEIHPDIIFTHYRRDLHQDHRLICELTWNTFRNHLILEYEIMKYDGDLGNPNFYVHLSEDICRNKIQAVFHHFKSQMERSWFSEDSFFSLLRLRGLESNAPARYAEAFYCRKGVL